MLQVALFLGKQRRSSSSRPALPAQLQYGQSPAPQPLPKREPSRGGGTRYAIWLLEGLPFIFCPIHQLVPLGLPSSD